MKKIIAALILAVPFLAGGAYAADKADSKTADAPKKMTLGECSTKNKGLKGDEFKKAQSECMKGESAAPAADAPKKKMTLGECSTKNKGLKGDEFKKAQSECMKG